MRRAHRAVNDRASGQIEGAIKRRRSDATVFKCWCDALDEVVNDLTFDLGDEVRRGGGRISD